MSKVDNEKNQVNQQRRHVSVYDLLQKKLSEEPSGVTLSIVT